jgi:hypothetical protein
VNQAEATDLAKRIINCWRGGPPLTEWIDELKRLDAGMAGTAYIRLRREHEHAPSIARFLAEYRGVHGPTDSQPARSNEERISLNDYLSRLAGRAAKGSEDAREELASWQRWLAPKDVARLRHPSIRRQDA